MNMIQTGRPKREGTVSKEIHALADKQLENMSAENNTIHPYWMLLMVLASVVLTILLL
jgi:hypothetical protein